MDQVDNKKIIPQGVNLTKDLNQRPNLKNLNRVADPPKTVPIEVSTID